MASAASLQPRRSRTPSRALMLHIRVFTASKLRFYFWRKFRLHDFEINQFQFIFSRSQNHYLVVVFTIFSVYYLLAKLGFDTASRTSLVQFDGSPRTDPLGSIPWRASPWWNLANRPWGSRPASMGSTLLTLMRGVDDAIETARSSCASRAAGNGVHMIQIHDDTWWVSDDEAQEAQMIQIHDTSWYMRSLR